MIYKPLKPPHSNKGRFSYYLRLANFTTFVIFFWIIAWYAAFLYRNFYKVITESDIIIILRQEVAVSQINYPKFLDVLNKIKEKQALAPIDPKKIKNPFIKYE